MLFPRETKTVERVHKQRQHVRVKQRMQPTQPAIAETQQQTVEAATQQQTVSIQPETAQPARSVYGIMALQRLAHPQQVLYLTVCETLQHSQACQNASLHACLTPHQ